MPRISKLMVVLILSICIFNSAAYNESCLVIIRTALALPSNSSSAIEPNSMGFGSTREKPIISLEVCEARCGAGSSTYRDVWTRLFTWPIPIIILVTCFLLAPIGKARFFAIVHLFGDTIHSTWALIQTLERRRSLRYEVLLEAEPWDGWEVQSKLEHIKCMVIISIAIQDLLPEIDQNSLRSLPICCCHDPELRAIFRRAAAELVDNTVFDILRTWVAILLYIAGLVFNFFPDSDGEAMPSGGTLGVALQLAWLLPTLLLSNAVGQPHSALRVVSTIRSFEEETRKSMEKHKITCRMVDDHENWADRIRSRDWNKYLDSIVHTTSITADPIIQYGQKPKIDIRGCRRSLLVLLLSALPLMIAFTSAFVTMFSSPTWFSCRHIQLVSIFTLLIISFILTIFIARSFQTDHELRYKYIVFKDFLVAIPIIVLLFVSTTGIYNSCWCRSSVYTPGKGRVVRLNPLEVYQFNGHVMYPTIVAITIPLEIGVFVAILVMEKVGIKMWKWTERDRREALFRGSELEIETGLVGGIEDQPERGKSANVVLAVREVFEPFEFQAPMFPHGNV